MAGGPPGLTLRPNSRLTQEEIVTGERLGKQLGVQLLEGSHVGEEYIIAGTKKTIDAMGTPQAFAHWNAKEFTGSIINHLNKSVDYVAIDLAGASKSQVQTVKKFVEALTEEQRNRTIYVH
jgi:hypothetical protein